MREELAILISGGGTTMKKIAEACQSGEVPMGIACVISSNPDAGGIEKARKSEIPESNIVIVNPNDFTGADGKIDQYGFGQAILKVLKGKGATVVSLNGWLPRIPDNVIDPFRGAIFNQHPGPKRETRATHGIQPHAIMLYLARHLGRNEGTEVIVHRVTSKWDDGALLGFTKVPIYLPYDYPRRIQERALRQEHLLQIEHLKRVARGDIEEIPDHQYIRTGEKSILSAARQYARRRYPHG